jgi:glycine/D-amino acid oxidase-like deaminating enzyme
LVRDGSEITDFRAPGGVSTDVSDGNYAENAEETLKRMKGRTERELNSSRLDLESAGMSLDRRAFVASLLAAPLLARPSNARARMVRRADHVVVIGAGAFGGWTALSLLRAGFRVTLVDAWGAGHARASSGGETRVIRAVYGGEPVYIRMARRALDLWREAERRWERRVFHEVGALWMFAGDDAFARRSAAPMHAAGLSLEEMTPAEAARRWPQMQFGDVRSVFFEPRAGYLLAREACELVRETFVAEGGAYRVAEVRPGVATGVRLPAVSLSSGERLEGDRFVFACGPWMGRLFPDVIGRRIVATRQEVFFFGTPAGSAQYDDRALPAWVHMGDRVVYGVPGNQRRGLKVADDSAGPEVDPTTQNRIPSQEGIARARVILRERFPALADAPLVEARVCQYEASSDGNFLVDRHPRLDNVWLVGGGSGHGFKMGPALGEHVAGLVRRDAGVEALFSYRRLRPRALQER